MNDGWKEAAIAWTVTASIHQGMVGPKRDALYSTRQADFVRHADDARGKALATTQCGCGQPWASCQSCSQSQKGKP